MRLKKGCSHKDIKTKITSDIYKRYRIVDYCSNCGKIKRQKYRMEKIGGKK